jgi:hypothetical protein
MIHTLKSFAVNNELCTILLRGIYRGRKRGHHHRGRKIGYMHGFMEQLQLL